MEEQQQPRKKRIAPTVVASLLPQQPTKQDTVSQEVEPPTDGTAAAHVTETAASSSVLKDPYTCSANEAISLRFVATTPELGTAVATASFHPTFTHQVVAEDQLIHGYRGLHCDVWVSAASLRAYVASRWDAVAPAPLLHDADPALAIARKMPSHSQPVNSLPAFASIVAQDQQGTFVPPGTVIASGDLDDGSVFEVRLADISSSADAVDARQYHERAQIFVLWLIDGGSYIDCTELGWRAFFLFRRSRDGRSTALLGYTTAFFFYNYPDSTRIRISQFLIFPPYQRHGHGLRLIEAVYNYAKDPKNKVADITVEDPDEEFRPLRDLADLRALRSAGFFVAPSSDGMLDKSVAETARKRLKICKQQLAKCHNVFEFGRACAQGSDAVRLYRLRLKAQIAVLFSDWLQDCKTPEDRKRVLDEIYTEHERDFKELLLALDRTR